MFMPSVESFTMPSVRRAILASFVLLFMSTLAAQPLVPDITVTKVIDAPVADVWNAWTTVAGIESFFAPKAAKVVPEPGGAFELWFGVDLPEGTRLRRFRRSVRCAPSSTSTSRPQRAIGRR